MTLVTHFGRTHDGQYTSIEQFFDGNDIPEGTTFVGFDAVKFAEATGQIAVLYGVERDAIEEGSLLLVENTDERWDVGARVENDNISLQYYGLGPRMISALAERGVEDPKLTADCIKVVQHIDEVRSIDYIGDGPLDLTGENRYSSDFLPVPHTDVAITPENDLLSAFHADPNDELS